MFENIKQVQIELDCIENLEEDWQLEILIGVGWNNTNKRKYRKKNKIKNNMIRSIVLKYIQKVY